MVLANSITLTPGTLSVDIAGDQMYIHWVDVESRDVEAASRRITASFEKYLEVIFG
jgi:multicomponent Na+:H+ antiporter subunit E